MNDHHPNPHPRPTPASPAKILRAFIGTFLGIGTIAIVDQYFLSDGDLTLVIGAFGATSVLVYGAPSSPLAQPYNVIIGHLVSAAIGVSVFQFIGEANWLSAALAVSLAIAGMQATRSVHPPGGASALIAVIASQEIHNLGFLYVFYPVGLGAVILVGVAWVTNNVRSEQRWPTFWF